MIHLTAIDIPALLLAKIEGEIVINPIRIIETLENLDKNTVLIYPENLIDLLDWSSAEEEMYKILDLLSKHDSETYSSSAYKKGVSTIPELTHGLSLSTLKDAIYLQMCYIHLHSLQNNILYMTYPERWESKEEKLRTIRDKKAKEYETLIIDDTNKLQEFYHSRRPVLVQLKHGATEKTDSNHHTVSAFSSYNAHDTRRAESLLLQAYNNSRETEAHPKYLYAWDEKADCYVEFRHSGNNEYHGFDLPSKEYSKVPEYIKSKYHRYK